MVVCPLLEDVGLGTFDIHFVFPGGVEECGKVGLVHDGNTAGASSDGLMCRYLLDLEAFTGSVDGIDYGVLGGGLGSMLIQQYCVNPVRRYFGILVLSWGLAQGFHRAMVTLGLVEKNERPGGGGFTKSTLSPMGHLSGKAEVVLGAVQFEG